MATPPRSSLTNEGDGYVTRDNHESLRDAWDNDAIDLHPEKNVDRLLGVYASEYDRIDNDLARIRDERHVDTASGESLDALGDLVGVQRTRSIPGLDYTNTSHDLSSELSTSSRLSDFHFDGTDWWVVDSTPGIVYQYDSSWNYTDTSIDVSPEDGTPEGIYFDGTNWWMVGSDSLSVHKYDSSWAYTGVSFDVSSEVTEPRGLYFDGTNWWVIGADADAVFKYDSSWSYTGTSYSTASELQYPEDIHFDGTNWWALSRYNELYQYDSSWSYTGNNITVADSAEITVAITNVPGSWLILDDFPQAALKYTKVFLPEGDDAYRARIIGNAAASLSRTTFDGVAQTVSRILATDPQNLELDTEDGVPATVFIRFPPEVLDATPLSSSDVADLVDESVPAGHNAQAEQKGTFEFASDTYTPPSGTGFGEGTFGEILQ